MELEMMTKVIARAALGMSGVLLAAVSLVTHGIQEDDPGWDCHTMGNKSCERIAVVPPRPVMK